MKAAFSSPMKLHLAGPGARHQITASGEGWVDVNGQRHHASLVVLPESIIAPWPVPRIEALALEHSEAIAATQAQVVLLGTGPRMVFPPRALLKPLYAAGIGVEVMDTRAACRTYNILAAEGRAVAAALIIG